MDIVAFSLADTEIGRYKRPPTWLKTRLLGLQMRGVSHFTVNFLSIVIDLRSSDSSTVLLLEQTMGRL